MATFYGRGKSWQARVRVTGYPALSRTFSKKADAQRWASEVEAEIHAGAFLDMRLAEQTPLRDLFTRYRLEVCPTRRGGQVEAYRLAAWERQHPLADMAVAKITPALIARWRDTRLEGGKQDNPVKPDTVIRELTLFQQELQKARKEWGIHLHQNPASAMLVDRPRTDNPDGRERRLLPGEEDGLLAGAVRGGPRGTRVYWLRPLIILAIETAARSGELLKLNWEHVDLQARIVTIIGTTTKTWSKRTIPLSRRAVQAFEALKPQRDGPVVRISHNARKLAWKRCLSRARRSYEHACNDKGQEVDPRIFNDLTFHDLRHEATSRLFEKGFSLMEVMSITGHKDPKMLKRYTHVETAALVERLD